MNKLFVILLLLGNLSFTQVRDSMLIEHHNELASFVSEIMNSPFSSTRIFQKIEGKDIPIELFELKKLKQNITEIYSLVSDSNKVTYYFTTTKYLDSEIWSSSHSYYFDSTGRTIFYFYHFAFYDSLCDKNIKKLHAIYFSTNFDIIRQGDWYEDENSKTMEDISDCLILYNFDLEYMGCNNFQSVIKKYKIKL